MRDLADLLASRGARLGLKIAGVGLAVAVLALAAWLWLRAEDSRGVAALAASADLVQLANGPQATPDARARAIDALQVVMTQHARSSAAVQAAYEGLTGYTA